MKKLTNLFLKKGSKRVVEITAEVVARSPETASLTETFINRFSTYANVLEKLLHFHLIGLGVVLGFTLMTATIALGKLAIALEFNLFIQHRDLIFNIGYFTFFASILFGFYKHYMSSHYERSLSSKIARLEADFGNQQLMMEVEFKEKKEALEDEFLERNKTLGLMIKEQEQKLDLLTKKAANEDNKNTVWDSFSNFNPIKKSNKRTP
jgi:hypothetical protein